MKTLRYGLIVLVVGFVFGVALAQDTLPPNRCTQDDYLVMYEQVNLLNENFKDIATYDPIETANNIRFLMNSMQGFCSGIFTDETHPNGIIGPIAFDGTLYEVTFTTPLGDTTATRLGGTLAMETISGDCGFGNTILTSGIKETETDLFRMGGDCVGIMEINRVDGGWHLSIVKIQ